MQVGTSLVRDILAGEQGPSCKTLEQIPDMKVDSLLLTSKIVYQSGGLTKVILKWYDPIAILLQD